MSPTELTAYIHEHIPLTGDLQAEVIRYDGDGLQVAAPLEPNLNHRNSAFGGSLSALGILSGWALLFLKLKEEGIHTKLVIQTSSFEYLEPITGDFVAKGLAPSENDWNKFLKTLRKYGRARVSVTSTIRSNGENGGIHVGTYVAIVTEPNIHQG